MKFRISKKDLIILACFLVFLLYLCAIGVMNFVTFGSSGTLWGLNPFPAFSGAYLGLTLLLYVVCVIVIFASVSSYVFEKKGKKGIGLVVEDKVETGYSSWAKDKDIKGDRGVTEVDYTAPTVNAAGIPLIYDTKKHKVWVDNGEYHTVVIGASGSGKSQCIVKPLVNLLAKKGESMIITDPKGELYTSAAHRLKDLGYNVIVLNFRDPLNGNAWNPLTLPYQYMKMGNMDKATELLDDVALNILYDPNNKGEPFWEKSAADFFSGLALGLFQDAKEEEININSISYMSTVGEERLGPSNYTKEYFTMKGESSSAYTFAANTINAPSDTKGGIMSTFRQKIRLFASRENLSEMLGHSDFSILDIGRQKTAVFIVIHDEKTTYHALATIFIKQAYETLIDVAQKNGGKLPIRTNFILDEFANMPPLKDVDSMVTAARSRDMRFTFINKLVKETVVKPHESKERERSRKIDKILTGKYTGVPAFIIIMALVFYLTFNVFGAWGQTLMEMGVDALTKIVDKGLTAWDINPVLHSLVIDGVFQGVGSIISFLPIIVILFFFLSLLEDTGYMARVAFVSDKLLRKIGLSGRSIVPMLIGFGCSVPSVMASRTLPSERDRKMTIMLTPFMSCTAKLPIYAFFAAAFFPKQAGLVMVGLYIFGIVMGIITALISKQFLFKGEAVPFVMELPNYRMPSAKTTFQLLWEKAKDFLQPRGITLSSVKNNMIRF